MYRYYSVKDICNETGIHRNTFYKKTASVIKIIKFRTNQVRQCLFTEEEKQILIEVLKNSVKKVNKPFYCQNKQPK
jgi:hypothetical protein